MYASGTSPVYLCCVLAHNTDTPTYTEIATYHPATCYAVYVYISTCMYVGNASAVYYVPTRTALLYT